MQIWKFIYMFLFIQYQYTENFAFLIIRILKLFTCKICEMSVHKHTETIDYIKK